MKKGGGTLRVALYPDLLGGCLPFFAVEIVIVCEDSCACKFSARPLRCILMCKTSLLALDMGAFFPVSSAISYSEQAVTGGISEQKTEIASWQSEKLAS